MRLVFSWLKEFVDYQGTPEELGELLTMRGLEVEGVERVGEEIKGLVVGRVLEVGKHPNADKLHLCKVDTGDEVLEVVCGAPNVKSGIKVPVAKVGARLPGGLKIKKAKIRGVYSFGMILSAQELGLEEKSEGIMVLGDDVQVGRDLTEVLPLKDAVLDISITPNRGDCLSVLGVAREVSAATGLEVSLPDTSLNPQGEDIERLFSVYVEDGEGCFRYVAMGVVDVSIGDAPLFMKRRLELSGMRPINNVVDITNYVMLELGQPLHAFDWDLLRGGKIVVKRWGDISFKTLDGVERRITGDDLLICDGEGPVAIAGVMGGENSEIRDETRRVLLESACFNPAYIRRTSRRLSLTTEASYRFERGVDPELQAFAAKRACHLMERYAGGKVLPGVIDVRGNKPKKSKVFLPKEGIENFLGVEMDDGFVERTLGLLGFKVQRDEGGFWCEPPSWRYDVSIKEDVLEELARFYGYENIPSELPRLPSIPDVERLWRLRRRIRAFFASLGVNEVITYSFVRKDLAELFFPGSVPLLNPLSEEMSHLRTSIVPSLALCASKNSRYGIRSHRYFEFRKVFFKDNGFLEKERLAVLIGGERCSSLVHGGHYDFFDLKGMLELFLESFHVKASFEPKSYSFFIPGVSAVIKVGGKEVGFLGKLSPEILSLFELEGDFFAAELFMDELYPLLDSGLRFEPYSKYPVVWMDLAYVMDKKFNVGRVLDEFERLRDKYKLIRWDVVDVYEGKPLPEDKKSVTFRLYYCDMNKTLTDEEVKELHGKLSEEVRRALGLEYR